MRRRLFLLALPALLAACGPAPEAVRRQIDLVKEFLNDV